jgi:hypothetical protein
MAVLAVQSAVGAAQREPCGLVGLNHAAAVDEVPFRVAATAIRSEFTSVHIGVAGDAFPHRLLEPERLMACNALDLGVNTSQGELRCMPVIRTYLGRPPTLVFVALGAVSLKFAVGVFRLVFDGQDRNRDQQKNQSHGYALHYLFLPAGAALLWQSLHSLAIGQ